MRGVEGGTEKGDRGCREVKREGGRARVSVAEGWRERARPRWPSNEIELEEDERTFASPLFRGMKRENDRGVGRTAGGGNRGGPEPEQKRRV